MKPKKKKKFRPTRKRSVSFSVCLLRHSRTDEDICFDRVGHLFLAMFDMSVRLFYSFSFCFIFVLRVDKTMIHMYALCLHNPKSDPWKFNM